MSGPGLSNVFKFLVSSGKPDTITAGLVNPDAELPRAIAEAALAESDPTAEAALTIMLTAWAAECRSIALRVMPFGGLYLGGGLAPKLLPAIKKVEPPPQAPLHQRPMILCLVAVLNTAEVQ